MVVGSSEREARASQESALGAGSRVAVRRGHAIIAIDTSPSAPILVFPHILQCLYSAADPTLTTILSVSE